MVQSTVSAGENVAVSINGSAADAIQGALSSPFGFADFVTDSGVVRVARPVAVAETADGLDDQTAIVRVRQNGEDSLSVSFYRVDDFQARSTACSRDRPATPRRRRAAPIRSRAAARRSTGRAMATTARQGCSTSIPAT